MPKITIVLEDKSERGLSVTYIDSDEAREEKSSAQLLGQSILKLITAMNNFVLTVSDESEEHDV